MTPERTSRSPAGRFLSEFGVIVLGVLVALLAESAWHERGERVEEAQVLDWISQDLSADSARLAIDRAWIDLVRPAVSESRTVLAGRDTLSPIGRLALLYAASTIRTDPRLIRTWDDLVASGRISLIRDADLRRSLIDFYGRLAELREDQEALPTDFRTTIIAILPTEFARAVLSDCLRDEDQEGPRPDVEEALRGCAVDPGESPLALLDRIRSAPGIERALGELTYDLAGIGETLERTEASLAVLRSRLEEVREGR